MKIRSTMITMTAVLGILALAQGAVASLVPVVVPVVNGDFEGYVGTTSGVAHNTFYEYWDIVADGQINGHLTNLSGQPTSGLMPTGWTAIKTAGGDSMAHDARWGNWWNSWGSGGTNGPTIVMLDDRRHAASQNDYLYQTLGTVSDLTALGGGPLLTGKIDARAAKASGDEFSDEYIAMFFRVGGVGDADSDGAWKSLLQGDYEIPTWADLGNPIQNHVMPDSSIGYGTAVKGDPGEVKEGTIGPQNMGTFSATIDLSAFDDGDIVEIVIQQVRNSTYDGGRVFIDNVRVTAIPEPGTIALLGLAGLAMLIRRRFVK